MGLPSEPMKGVRDTAAEIDNFCAPSILRSFCKKERKLALSLLVVDTTLQPIPCKLGYSQLQNRCIKCIKSGLKKLKQINALKIKSVKVVH